MSGICLPIDADTTSHLPAFPAAQNRVADSLMLSALPGRPLGGRSGIRLGAEPVVTIPTSTSWQVTPFTCAVDPGAALTIGPYRVAFLANETGTITAADASNQRVDILYVQVPDDPAPAGAANRVATLGYTAGIPGAAGGAIGAAGGRPATPARSMLLGTITVPKVGTGSPVFTPAFPYLAAPGAAIPVRSQAERDALASPFTGLKVERLDLGGATERYLSGTGWVLSAGTALYTDDAFPLAGSAWDNVGQKIMIRRRFSGTAGASGLMTVTYSPALPHGVLFRAVTNGAHNQALQVSPVTGSDTLAGVQVQALTSWGVAVATGTALTVMYDVVGW